MPDLLPAPAAPTEDPNAVTDHVRIVIEAEPAHLNPDAEPDAWGRRISFDAIYEPLTRALPDGAGGLDIKPMLAERWTISDEGHRYLFQLREGVRWHDGKPLTSGDVAFTLDRLRSPKSHHPIMQSALAEIERVELAGRLGVRVELRHLAPRLLHTLAEIAILPEHVFDKSGELLHHPANRHPVGTGPLRLEEWQKRRIVLTRFDDYWGERAAAAQVEIAIEPDGARALFAAKRGELDVLGHVPPPYVPDQLETPAIGSRFATVRVHAVRCAFVLWNVARAPLDEPLVRRALAAAIDRRRVVEEARHGLGRPLDSVPAGVRPDPIKPDAPALAAANAALDAAGLVRGSGAVRARGGRAARLTLLVPSASREAEVASRIVADAVGRLGLPVDVVPLELSKLYDRMRRGTFDGALLEWTGADGDDLEPILGSRGAWSLGGFKSARIDALLDALRTQTAGEARMSTRSQLADAVAEEAPALFLYGPDEVYLYARRLRPQELPADFFRLREIGPP